jgi:hypothetical protein
VQVASGVEQAEAAMHEVPLLPPAALTLGELLGASSHWPQAAIPEKQKKIRQVLALPG